MVDKIIQVSSGQNAVIALSENEKVYKLKTGDFGSTAWVDITPITDAHVFMNPHFQKSIAFD